MFSGFHIVHLGHTTEIVEHCCRKPSCIHSISYVSHMENTIFETNLLPQKHSLIKFSDDEGENIYLGSPFYGAPNLSGIKAKVNTLLILDLNILSDLRSRKNSNNIRRLLTWAAEHSAEITPLVALSEQQRTHKSPRYAYDEYLDALKAEYGWSIN